VKGWKVSFYYVSSDKDEVPKRPLDVDEWSKFITNNRIGHNTQKRLHEGLQQIAMLRPVPLGVDERKINENELHENARQQAGLFWKDKRISKLFNSSDVENTLLLWIKKLKVAEFDVIELGKLVNKSEEHPLEIHHVFDLQMKAMYLRRAYEYALEDMPAGKSWKACCEHSIEILCQLGITRSQCFRTIEDWHVYFWIAGLFPHPNPFVELEKEVQPNFFALFLKPEMNFNVGQIRILSCSTVIWQLNSFGQSSSAKFMINIQANQRG